jgi:hypothetical protein
MNRTIPILGYVIALAFTFSVLSHAHAQAKAPAKKGMETIKGTVVSIEKEKTGKNYKLKMKRSDDDEELDVSITAKTALFVNAKGDEEFLKPEAFVETKVTKAQDMWTADELTIYLGALNNVQPKMTPDADDPEKTFNLAGSVVATDTDAFMLDCGMEQVKVHYERGSEVNLKIADPTMIAAGDEVEVEGMLPKGKKVFNAIGVQSTKSETIAFADYQAQQEEKKKAKPGAASKTKVTTKTKTETKTETKTTKGGKAGSKVDPFGVGGDDKDADTDDAKADDAKKIDSKKEPVKKSATKKAVPKKDNSAKKEAAKEALKQMMDESENQ